jgi:hypothetical protein
MKIDSVFASDRLPGFEHIGCGARVLRLAVEQALCDNRFRHHMTGALNKSGWRAWLRTLTTAASFIAAIVLAIIWALDGSGGDRVLLSPRVHGVRYTLRIADAQLELRAPPGHAVPADPALSAWLAKRSDDLPWVVLMSWTDQKLQVMGCAPADDSAPNPAVLRALDAPGAAGALLDALEDSRHLVWAHYALTRRLHRGLPNPCRREGDTLCVGYNGLDVTLRPAFPARPPPAVAVTAPLGPRERGEQQLARVRAAQPFVVVCPASAAQVDRGQLPRIRRQWHDLLDVRVASAPLAGVVGLLLIPPVWWSRRKWRRRRAVSRGLCPARGYDLRESPLRCPECGRAVDSEQDASCPA